MSKYPKRYRVEILWGRSLMRAALDVACLPHGRWMEAEEVIKEIDKRDAHIETLEKALADKGVGMSALFGKG